MAKRPDLGVDTATVDKRVTRAPWLPLIIIVLAQLQMAINVSALPVSLGPISEDLDAPATATATALLLYSLFVAAFVMLGAKLGKLVGELLVFRVCVVAHGVFARFRVLHAGASKLGTTRCRKTCGALARPSTSITGRCCRATGSKANSHRARSASCVSERK